MTFMLEGRNTNRTMFWRILRRLLGANRGRLFVILLALGSGATIIAALLNLQVDAKRRLTTEFRALGANVVVSPKGEQNSASGGPTLSQDALRQIPPRVEGVPVPAAPFLYVVADVSTLDGSPVKAVVVGSYLHLLHAMAPGWQIYPVLAEWNASSCIVGSGLSSRLKLSGVPELRLSVGQKNLGCYANQTLSSGGPEDNQVFVYLPAAQSLASLPGRVSLIQVSVPGTPQSLERYIADLQKQLPYADVRPIRQFTEAEARIYNRISNLLTATVAVVLILTALCVMAAMTNVAMERQNDVALMKAIGGATRRVLRLFLAEAALLGLAGGFLGAAAGILLSMWLGKAVFGLAARPRLIVYPVAVALTIIVAIAGAYPLRRLASVRPASVFRGET
jgi:putative ABC transport system permease protein